MKFAIVYIVEAQNGTPAGWIGPMYDAEASTQSEFAGDHGNPLITKHVPVPGNVDPRCAVAEVEDGEVTITEDPVKKQEVIKLDLRERVLAAVTFGQELILDFTVENVALGITQEGKTAQVLAATAALRAALASGSLYEAIALAKAIPNEQKDQTFITDARLLIAVNKLEVFLGLPESESL